MRRSSNAKKGPLPEMNGGAAKTNPIHDGDLAQVCADAIEGKTGALMQVGRRSSRAARSASSPSPPPESRRASVRFRRVDWYRHRS